MAKDLIPFVRYMGNAILPPHKQVFVHSCLELRDDGRIAFRNV